MKSLRLLAGLSQDPVYHMGRHYFASFVTLEEYRARNWVLSKHRPTTAVGAPKIGSTSASKALKSVKN